LGEVSRETFQTKNRIFNEIPIFQSRQWGMGYLARKTNTQYWLIFVV